MAYGEAAVAPRLETRIARDVAGDQEAAGAGAGQPPLHRLGALGKTEGDGGFTVDACDRRPGDQLRLAKIFGADAEPVQRKAVGKVVPLADSHGDAERTSLNAVDLDVVLQRTRQRVIHVGPAQRL